MNQCASGTCCQTALVSVASLIKAFQNKPLLLALCGLKKSVSWYWCLFIYKHQYAWQWKKKKNNLCITLCSDTSCAHMHLFVLVHGKKKGKSQHCFLLSLHFYSTEIHKEPQINHKQLPLFTNSAMTIGS